MRKAIFLVTGAAILGALPGSPAEARGIRPGHYAYSQLEYGSGWRLYDAGCLKWNFQNRAWYTRCGFPQNGPDFTAAIPVRYLAGLTVPPGDAGASSRAPARTTERPA